MRIQAFALLAFLCCAGPAAWSEDSTAPARLDRIAAFEQAYGASFYLFDACGDGVAGRIYRQALTAKFGQCPFTDAARERFRIRSRLQREKASDAIKQMIEEHGGLPVRLSGMAMTCHEQSLSPEYRAVRQRLDTYAAGRATPEAVVPEPCGADAIAP